MPMPLPPWRDVLGFWREAGPERWFAKDDAFDQAIRSRFLRLQQAAARGDLASWEETADGALALIILLDQFPRNLFRRSPRAFASDAQARGVARRALSRGFERRCDRELVQFLYMPLIHSGALADQDRGLDLFEALGWPEALRAARTHRDVIARFGRFPHRNAVLGRVTTPEERLFLDQDGFAG